jgi:adenylate cyclase
MIEVVDEYNNRTNHHEEIQKRLPIKIRIGIATGGPVIAGIIVFHFLFYSHPKGDTKLQYDLWGETVNLASRMESSGPPGKIHLSQETYLCVKDDFNISSIGEIHVKGIGNVQSYILDPSLKLENMKE